MPRCRGDEDCAMPCTNAKMDIRLRTQTAVRVLAPGRAGPQHPPYSSARPQELLSDTQPRSLDEWRGLRRRPVCDGTPQDSRNETPSFVSEMLFLRVYRGRGFNPNYFGQQYLFQRKLSPAYRAVCIRERQIFAVQSVPNPPQHFLGCCRDEDGTAANTIKILDPFFLLHDSEDMIRPCRLAGQAEKAHKRGPRFLPLVAQENCATDATIGVKLLGDRNQVAHRMFPVREIDRPLVARGALSKGHFPAAAVGKGQRERRFFVHRRRDRADVRIVAEDAQ